MKLKMFLLIFSIVRIETSYSQIIPQWTSTYSNSNDGDAGTSIALDAMGNVFVTGMAAGFENSIDILTIKYNSIGVRQWVKSYHTGGNSYSYANDIAVDAFGNVYVTGNGNGGYIIIKYNTSGDQVWVRSYHGPNNLYDDDAYSIAVDSQDNIFVTGGSKKGDYNFDYVTLKYDSSGNQLWVQRYNGTGNENDIAYSIAADLDGNVYVTGFSFGDSTNYDYCTIKYSSTGQELWIKRYDGIRSFEDAAYSVILDNNGNVYVTGYSYGNETFRDFATIKYDTSGEQMWVQRYSGKGFSYDEASALAIDLKGNVYVTGKSNEVSVSEFDYVTIKYNGSGAEQWVQRYNGTGNSIDAPSSIVVGKNGIVFVTGYSYGNGTESDMLTIAYDSVGVQKWIERRDGSAHGSESGYSLVMDSSDNLFLTGSIMQTGTYIDVITIKYSQTTGINPASDLFSAIYNLYQNYPNPFNPVTKIIFDIPSNVQSLTSNVKLTVYNTLGEELQVLLNERLNAGSYEVDFDGSNFVSGVYFYKLEAGRFIETKRMILLK